MISVLSLGRFTAAVGDASLVRRHQLAAPPVIYCHGAGSSALMAAQMLGSGGYDGIRAVSLAACDAGFPVVAPTTPDLWGNSTAMTRLSAALTWARANGASPAPAVVIGASMGAATALRWAYTHPEDCACVIGIIPALDVTWVRDNDPEGIEVTAAVNTAWGTVGTDPLPAGADPALFAAELDLPVQLWTASDDDVSHGHATFTATTGAEWHDLGALGHTTTAVAAVTPATVVSFIQANT